jgi:hypothetical protein
MYLCLHNVVKTSEVVRVSTKEEKNNDERDCHVEIVVEGCSMGETCDLINPTADYAAEFGGDGGVWMGNWYRQHKTVDTLEIRRKQSHLFGEFICMN